MADALGGGEPVSRDVVGAEDGMHHFDMSGQRYASLDELISVARLAFSGGRG